MKLVPWRPFGELGTFRREMEDFSSRSFDEKLFLRLFLGEEHEKRLFKFLEGGECVAVSQLRLFARRRCCPRDLSCLCARSGTL